MRICFALVLLASALPAQVADNANSGYKTREGRENVARGLGGPGRDERQKPLELIAAMKLRPGMAVADLGTGAGYMLPFLSRAVGPDGKVIAEDIFPDFLDKARAHAAEEKLENVTFIQGTDKDPKLPEAALGVVLALDAYHHFDYPDLMLAVIRKSLAPGGRFVLVEYYRRKEAMNGRALGHIRLDEADVIREIESNGFELVESHPHIPRQQYMATFRVRAN